MAQDEHDRKLKDANKKLRAEVRQLRKQLKTMEEEIQLITGLWEQDILDQARNIRREKLKEKKEPLCPECGNPGLDVKLLGAWKVLRCQFCEFFSRDKE